MLLLLVTFARRIVLLIRLATAIMADPIAVPLDLLSWNQIVEELRGWLDLSGALTNQTV